MPFHPTSPQLFPPGTTFRDLFPANDLVYIRDTRSLNKKNFNSNPYDLIHILSSKDTNFNRSTRLRNETTKVVNFFQDDQNSIETSDLGFESRFESGNLSMAKKISDNEYNLLLQNDVNTFGAVQWFFFRVHGGRFRQKVKFNIINLYKSESLFTQGMQISVYSCKNFELNKEGWHKGGTKINYFANNIERPNGKPYYTLSFYYEFMHEFDIVYFAYAVPYTYTDLLRLLDSYEQDQRISQILLRIPLCRTIGDNIIYLLTITSPGTREELKKKKLIFLSARVHPGETVSSFIMEGIINFLTGTSTVSQALREKFIFKIIPMLNPDGVINGNNRCSLLGVDLNRRWKKPSASLHPEIFHYKKLIKNSQKTHKIGLIADFHGHSIKHNIFIYGCNYPEAPHICKAFPLILSKNSNFFSYSGCNFSMNPSKYRTLRIVMFKELGVDNTFTVESSFCGSDFGKYKDMQVTTKMLKRFGEEFCRSLLMLESCLMVPRSFQDLKMCVESAGFNADKDKPSFIWDEFVKDGKILRSGEISSSGSDSEESEDYLDDAHITRKTKKRKSPNRGNATQSSKVLSPGKCKHCGKLEYPDHICVFLSKDHRIKQVNTPTFTSPVMESSRASKSPLRGLKNNPSSRLKLFNSPSQARISKVQSEANYKNKIINKTLASIKSTEKSLPSESIRTAIAQDTRFQPKELSIIDKNQDLKGLKSVSPIRGFHLLGIIEGVQCKLQKLNRSRGLIIRRNLNN